ncbi:MAG TPA: CoA transferase [Candidatus Ventrimonas merdavium]|nr:CoA transferase [Candidatus Ventrimonas merdavium]
MDKALKGVKVIQLANFIAAAATGRYLADHGADVIIVEAAKGDPLRYTQEQEGRPQQMLENTTWEYLNGNKRCISINTKTKEGMDALLKLLEDADVLVTNWRLAALERAGLDYETLKTKYPKLIYSMILGYGKTGPDKDLPGYDFTAFFGRGGYTENLRRRGGQPITMIPGLGDNNVGLMLALGIVTALYKRQQTGKGDFVSASLYETAIFNQSVMLMGAQYNGAALEYPISIYDNKNPLNGAYLSSDDRIIQCAMPDYNPRFEHFCEVIGRKDMIESGKFWPQADMLAAGNLTECIDEFSATFAQKTCEEWKKILTEGDIPFSVAYSWKEILEDPQANAIGAFYDCVCPNGQVRKVTHTPVRIDSEGELDGRTAPLIGEQGPEILKEIGYTDEQIAGMLENGSLYVWKPEQ